VYHIPPVKIGQDWSITYPIEMKNLGITKLKYKLDLNPIESMNTVNQFRIYHIENPEGVIKPNET